MINKIPVPKRLQDAVGKTIDQQVLNALLAQIVVDTVVLLFIQQFL
jgi:hypothetical protein